MTWNTGLLFPLMIPVLSSSRYSNMYTYKSETTELYLYLFHDTMYFIEIECVPDLMSGCRLYFHSTDSYIVWPKTCLKMLQVRIQIILSWGSVALYISKSESVDCLLSGLFLNCFQWRQTYQTSVLVVEWMHFHHTDYHIEWTARSV
jgi:hypothetical protein